jgi:protease IV
MRQFFKFLFASCLGTMLALVALFFLGAGAIGSLVSKVSDDKKETLEPNTVLELDFKAPIPEKTNNMPIDPFDKEQNDILGLTDMVTAIKTAKEDADIKGIYFNATSLAAGKATSSVLREALLDFKKSGKFIYAYADYYTQNAYYIASTADSILLNPVGMVEFKGFSSTIAYYKGMLDKLDVKMKIFYAGKFKSATEPFRMDKMSDENRLQVRQYLTGLYDIFIKDISKSRNIPESALRSMADNTEGRDADRALAAHLIDRIAYEDEVFDAMKIKIGLDKKDKLHKIGLEKYYAAKGKNLDFSAKDKIAVLYMEGEISDGENGDPGQIISGKMVKDIRKIREDDNIKALVLRINSPGGSVLASENILREVNLFKASGRPVVVSMGDVAASGGYYVACSADSIFAEPNTITGSIGVFGMFPMLNNTMKNKLGITYDTVRTARMSAGGSPFIEFSAEEDAVVQSGVDRIYRDFLKKVANGRKKTPEQIDEIAQGRVWTGIKAKDIGLVDDLGGINRAIESAAKLAGLEKYRTTEYPRTKKGWEQFIERFTKDGEAGNDNVKMWLLKKELGDMYPTFKTMQDFKKMKGVQARLPYELIVN